MAKKRLDDIDRDIIRRAADGIATGELRLDSKRAQRNAGFDLLTIAVKDRTALETITDAVLRQHGRRARRLVA